MSIWKMLLGLVLVSGAMSVRAQTINVPTCNSNDVQAALNSVSADNTVVNIPAGNCTWTTSVTYNQAYSTVIQGQTTCTGTPATSCNDVTILTDNLTRNGSDPGMLVINTKAGKSFRLTGITFAQINGGTTARTYDGTLRLYGDGQAVRVDHCHFNNINQTALGTDGVFGVIDHVVAYIPSEFWRPKLSSFKGVGSWGDNAFAQPTGFGTDQFMFLEDSTMTGGGDNGTTDCFRGGKMVLRHNILQYSSAGEHGTGHGGEDRACRAVELYQNTFQIPSGTTWEFNGMFHAGGPAMIWGNSFPTASPYYSHVVTAHINREDNATYPQSATPNGWGYCGTGVSGSGSNWDQNSNSSNGYACLDQPGRGQGDLLSNGFPNRVNTMTGTISWPRQRLEPVYEWGDTWSCSQDVNCSFWVNYDPGIVQNRDYFLGCGGTNSGSPASCGANSSCPAGGASCTAGVGMGTLAQRPAQCTTNSTSDSYGNHSGVGYWATDQNKLYVCTATNTWTAYYTPYTYPHPLQSSSGTIASELPPPIALQVVIQ